jgi:lysophosphatidylcholine acyltransferase/lyso-PAF acetyltransferase
MMALGFGTTIKHETHSIYDFMADYEPQQEVERAPVVAINHVSFLDIFYLFRRNMSFLAKLAVGKSPIFGPFAVARQCIFVNRSNKKEMSNVLDNINKRIGKNVENGNPPVIVFPEGTLSNGQSLLRFKRGAFMHNKPIKIMTL